MKCILVAALLVTVAATVAAPVPAFAQPSRGLTREQVREELVAAQASGQLPQQRGRNDFPVARAATPGTYAVATQESVARYVETSVPHNLQQ